MGAEQHTYSAGDCYCPLVSPWPNDSIGQGDMKPGMTEVMVEENLPQANVLAEVCAGKLSPRVKDVSTYLPVQ